MSEAVPRLETERLVMRGWRQSDTDAYVAMFADDDVAEFLGGPASREDAWRSMAMHAGHWALKGYGKWAVERRDDGLLVGRVGLFEPEGWLGLELGWVLARAAWGHGYAHEAARAAMAWAWTTLQAPRLISVIAVQNTRSIRVAQRLEMSLVGSHVLRGRPVDVYGIDRPLPSG